MIHGVFQIILEREVKAYQRYGESFCLALLDVDSFSCYNKIHGPGKGDLALKKVAAILQQEIRHPDAAARFSGDVFALILRKSRINDSRTALERIRHSVEVKTRGEITISAGIACCPTNATTGEGLILKAREALLQAKVAGKNRICSFKEKTRKTEEKFNLLLVDDEPLNLILMEAMLRPFNHEIIKASNGEEALSLINKVNVDLILLDVMMPGMNGYEVCRRLKQREETRLIPIIMLTALDRIEDRIRGIEAGVNDFITKPPNKIELTARVESLLRVHELNKKMTSIENVIISMANAVEAKDAYTQGHIHRVASMAVNLGRKMGLCPKDTDALWLSGILHDIGKIGVPREILNKPGRLDPDEWATIKRHPDMGYKICLPLKRTLGPALEAIRHHHEKLDGSGYPDGIRGEDISVLARIMAVVDIFDALNTDRPYRKGMPREKSFEILVQEAEEGKLDREIVQCFIEMAAESV